jgi:adenylate cyclase class 2
MNYEVEQKFSVPDSSGVRHQLAALGAAAGETVEQVDCYFAHPARDFAATDEAFRLRRVGQENCLTYKGAKLDTSTKTRREIEVDLADGPGSAADAVELFESLGFRRVREVRKRRSHFTLRWQDQQTEIALDEVAGLGTFVELEIMAGDGELDRAREALAALAARLGLSNSERRSYLELLMSQESEERQGAGEH